QHLYRFLYPRRDFSLIFVRWISVQGLNKNSPYCYNTRVRKRPPMKTLPVCLFLSLAVLGLAVPQFGNFTKVTTIPEGITYNELLSVIDCSDTDHGPTNSYVLTVVPSTPCGQCFKIFSCPEGDCLQYRAGVDQLDYRQAPSYLITIACDNGVDTPDQRVVQVMVVPSSPPVFDPDSLYVNISIDSHKTPARTVLFDVDAVDKDNDDVIYSLAVVPSTSAGHYWIDSFTGEIFTTVDTRRECDRNDVSLLVTITDGKTKVGPLVIDVSILNPNVSPRAANLDTTVQIPETAQGTAYSMMFMDDNTRDVFYTVTSGNSPGLAQYTIDGKSPNIDIKGNLNYETSALRSTVLDIQLTDGFCRSPLYQLTLTVTDVNEAPLIVPSVSRVEICEGKRDFNPGFRIVDEDASDVHKWSISNLTSDVAGHFGIDSSTGVMRTLLDYDVDMGAMAAKRQIIVQVTDKGGLIATATVDITILDCNDNAPVFNSANYSAAATECTAAGSQLMKVTATDRDSSRGMNNVLHYSGSGGAIYIASGGEIIVAQAMPAGTVLTFFAYAYDNGQTPGPLRSLHPAVVSVRFTKCPTPPPSTTTPVATTSHFASTTETLPKENDNTAWIIIASLLGTAWLGVLGYMLWRYGAKCLDVWRKINCGQDACWEKRR
ncbi:unnamed protein product, partial [Lymnaea stagnalis]